MYTMDVSLIKVSLDTSIFRTSISGRREYPITKSVDESEMKKYNFAISNLHEISKSMPHVRVWTWRDGWNDLSGHGHGWN